MLKVNDLVKVRTYDEEGWVVLRVVDIGSYCKEGDGRWLKVEEVLKVGDNYRRWQCFYRGEVWLLVEGKVWRRMS